MQRMVGMKVNFRGKQYHVENVETWDELDGRRMIRVTLANEQGRKHIERDLMTIEGFGPPHMPPYLYMGATRLLRSLGISPAEKEEKK